LAYHNDLRRNYGLNAPLVWNTTLENAAATYGAKCVFAHSSPGNNQYGENLAAAGGNGAFPIKPWKYQLDGWKNEESKWSCTSNSCASGGVCGHLTAQVWKSTVSIGCGVASCPAGTVFTSLPAQFLVCQYTPPGNVGKQHPLNPPSTSYSACPVLPSPDVNPTTIPNTTPTSPTLPNGTPKTPTPTPTPPVAPTPTPSSPTPTPSAPTTPTQLYPWSKCIGDYWPNGVRTPTLCKRAPSTIQNGLYCDVSDPSKNWWPVSNKNTSDCPYNVGYVSMLNSDETAQKGLLPMEAWIGIAVGIAVFIIIVIVVVIVVRNKQDERV
jgi:hypothetical protein